MLVRFLVLALGILPLEATLRAEVPASSRETRGYVAGEVIVKWRDSGGTLPTAPGSITALGAGPEPRGPDRWAKYAGKLRVRQARQLRRRATSADRPVPRPARTVPLSTGRPSPDLPGNRPARSLDGVYRIQVELQTGQSLDDVLDLLRADPEVEYAERNGVVTVDLVPNDPYYPVQWSLHNTGQPFPAKGGEEWTGTPGADIDVAPAWDLLAGAAEVVVAIADTGVDYGHRDLEGRVWVNEAERDGDPNKDDDQNGYVDDVYGYDFHRNRSDPRDEHGHGTFCAGIVAAALNNGLDMAGICPHVRIMAARMLDKDGGGGVFEGAEAICYAVDNGARIISCSWGFLSPSETLARALEYAHEQGVLVIVSAGNQDSDKPQYPSVYEHVIAVAATDANDRRASFSSYGRWVDLAAPGVNLLSLRATDTDMYIYSHDYEPGDRFVPHGDPNATLYIASGTSASAPVVAGVAALIMSRWPQAPLEQVEDRLLFSADDLSALNPDHLGLLGTGRVNAFRAVSPFFRAAVALDRTVYNDHDALHIRLVDFDLMAEPDPAVLVSTERGDSEIVPLRRDASKAWLFTGTLPTGPRAALAGDGTLGVADADGIAVTYADAQDEYGRSVPVAAAARVDAAPPQVVAVRIATAGASPRVEIETDEPTTVRILSGPGGARVSRAHDLTLDTRHSMVLADVSADTEYALVIELTDRAGNATTDDQGGAGYTLRTTPGGDVFVPGQYRTIREAVDNCWPGYTVWVADGTYTGDGNRDIDFRGKAIMVRSVNGPETCIIDCQGSETEPHRAFLFQTYEGPASILTGFTIINGYALDAFEDHSLAGSAILCAYAGPCIQNCVIQDNQTPYWGAALCSFFSRPIVTDCVFAKNEGAVILAEWSELVLRDCSFTENGNDQSAVVSSRTGTITAANCIFACNSCSEYEASFMVWGHEATLTSCLFLDNRGGPAFYTWGTTFLSDCEFLRNGLPDGTQTASATVLNRGSMTVVDCLFQDNRRVFNNQGRGTLTLENCTLTHNQGTALYSDFGGEARLSRCLLVQNRDTPINARGSPVRLSHCVVSGNSGEFGAVYGWQGATLELENTTIFGNRSKTGNAVIDLGWHDKIRLTNSITWNGGFEEIHHVWGLQSELIEVSYCDVQGGCPGTGNIDRDPMFVAASVPDANDWDLHLQAGSPCIDAGTSRRVWREPDGIGPPLDGDANGVALADLGAYEFRPAQGRPVLGVEPASIAFGMQSSADNPGAQSLQISNGGPGRLDWRVAVDPPGAWLQIDPAQGQAGLEQDVVTLRVEARDLPVGEYRCNVVFSAAQAANDPTVVPVTLYITEPLQVPAQYPTIQAALDAAWSGQAITVAPGTYGENLDFHGKDLVLSSLDPCDPGTVATTVIDGLQAGPVITLAGTETPACRVQGFTITGGRNSKGHGGGISGHGARATISHCTLIDNRVDNDQDGGGLADCDGLVENCIIRGNHASGENSSGGGLADCDGTIRACLIADNQADGSDGNGGGLAGCNGQILDCVITGNMSSEDGGGAFEGRGIISGCVLSGNWSKGESGGGLAYVSGAIMNCLIMGNRSVESGGGLDFCTGPVSHCTIVGNRTLGQGGGLCDCSGPITNCIIVDNQADAEGPQHWQSPNLSYSCFPGASGRGNLDADPCFARAGCWDPNGTPRDWADDVWIAGDYHLTGASACIDAGTDSPSGPLPATDLDGVPRPLDGHRDTSRVADLGCYEFNPAGPGAPLLQVNLRRFDFTAASDQDQPAPQRLSVRNWGAGTLAWQVVGNRPWLHAEPARGQSGAAFEDIVLTTEPAGLTPGVYTGALEVRSDDAVNSPGVIEVTLTVEGLRFGLCPNRLSLVGQQGRDSRLEEILSLRNYGSGPVQWRIESDCPWLAWSPSGGMLQAEQAQRVAVYADVSGLAPGRYAAALVVSDDAHPDCPRRIPVELDVLAEP